MPKQNNIPHRLLSHHGAVCGLCRSCTGDPGGECGALTPISAARYREAVRKPKKNKFGARKTVVDGITFASRAEAKFYSQLKLREQAREVGLVELQRPFALIGPDGMLITTYRCDFAFYDYVEDRFRVLDVKGGKATQTDTFRLKRKMMKSFLGIDVEVVTQ